MNTAEDKAAGIESDGIVAAAEQEILEELLASVESGSEVSGNGAAAHHPIAAVILMASCLAFTAYNLASSSRAAGDPGQPRRDAVQALELFATDIEAYHQLTGAYPLSFDNPFEDDSWRYERITPDHFRLTVAQEGEELIYDSRDGTAGRVTSSPAHAERQPNSGLGGGSR